MRFFPLSLSEILIAMCDVAMSISSSISHLSFILNNCVERIERIYVQNESNRILLNV